MMAWMGSKDLATMTREQRSEFWHDADERFKELRQEYKDRFGKDPGYIYGLNVVGMIEAVERCLREGDPYVEPTGEAAKWLKEHPDVDL